MLSAMIDIPPQITPEIAAALEQFAITPRRVVLISPLRDRKGSRLSYRVDAEDERVFKVRQLDSSERARRLLDLRAGLEAAFAPALANHGSVLLEEWIEGAPLSESDAEQRSEEAGALLGRLHARPLDADASASLSTSQRRAQAISNLEILSDAGQLTPCEADALRAELARRDPGTTSTVLVHMDFCAENMLIDTRGHLRIIDNEFLMTAPAGFDLGRTFAGRCRRLHGRASVADTGHLLRPNPRRSASGTSSRRCWARGCATSAPRRASTPRWRCSAASFPAKAFRMSEDSSLARQVLRGSLSMVLR